MASVPISRSELDFTVQAIRRENIRIDGRAPSAYRKLGIRFGATHGEVEVNFGPTRALAVCSGEVIVPPPERPNEGKIAFHVEFGPIASPSFEVGRPSVQANTVANFVERLLKGSKAVDAEALCIVGGQKVWSIRVDVRALDDDGNLCDVCAVAALCAVLHFRKKDVEVRGETATVFSAEERVPVPLSIHHIPVPVSYALFTPKEKDGEPTWIMDPNRLEEAAACGVLTVAVNQHGELCALHKPGGMPVDFSMVQHCVGLATAKAKEITRRVQADMERDLEKRKLERRNVHERYKTSDLLSVDWAAPVAKEGQVPTPPPAAKRPVTVASASELAAWRARAKARKQAADVVASEPAAPAAPAAAVRSLYSAELGSADMDEAALDAEAGAYLAAEIEAVEREAAEIEEQLRAAVNTGSRSGDDPSALLDGAEPPRKKKKRKKAQPIVDSH